MAIPSNITPAAAIEMGPLPYTVTLDVQDAPDSHTVWFKYTATDDDILLLIQAVADFGSNFVPAFDMYQAESPDDIVVWSPNTGISGYVWAVRAPVVAGKTYYFQVYDIGGAPTLGAPLIFSVLPSPLKEVPAGSFIITDDAAGYPPMFVSPAGEILRCLPLEYGDIGTMMPSGKFAIGDPGPERSAWVTLYNADLSTILPIWGLGTFRHVAQDWNDTFYVASDTVASEAKVVAVSDTGVFGDTYTLSASGYSVEASALSPDGTIYYYWYESQVDRPVHRFDLANNVELSDIITHPVGASPKRDSLITLSDGSLIIGYDNRTICRYGPTGVLLNTYDISGTGYYVNRQGVALDDPLTFWAWLHDPPAIRASSVFVNIRVSDGAILSTSAIVPLFDASQGPPYPAPWSVGDLPLWGVSISCSLLALRQALVLDVVSPSLSASASASPSPSAPAYSLYTASPVRRIRRLRQTPHVSDEQMWTYISSFQLDLETGIRRKEPR